MRVSNNSSFENTPTYADEVEYLSSISDEDEKGSKIMVFVLERKEQNDSDQTQDKKGRVFDEIFDFLAMCVQLSIVYATEELLDERIKDRLQRVIRMVSEKLGSNNEERLERM